MSLFKNWFRKSKNRPDVGDDFNISPPDRPRPHHYCFGHIDLRDAAFGNPLSFIQAMEGPDANDRLRYLWDTTGVRVVANKLGPTLPSSGLCVSFFEVEGALCPMITMPPAEREAEVIFAAFVPGVSDPRYLVLEWTDEEGDETPAGVICEWMADGSRRNHEINITADRSAFEEAISFLLQSEAKRIQAGAVPTGARTWNPGKGEEYDPENDWEEGFRVQHCLFAYHLIPNLSFEALEMLATGQEQSVEKVHNLWESAGKMAERAGRPEYLDAEGLSASTVSIAGVRYLLITMPEPVGPPEAYFLLAPLDRNKQSDSSSQIYSLEIPTARFGRGTIVGMTSEGTHAVVGEAEDIDQDSFIRAMEIVFSHGKLKSPAGLVNQLTLYGDVMAFIPDSIIE